MSFTSSLPLHQHSHSGPSTSTPYRRDRSRHWGYPNDHLFYRAHSSIIPHWPPDLYDDILGTVQGAHDDVILEKKANPGRKILVNKKGALQRFTEMPIDILYEIVGYLHPMDVLNLSRTTRSLRSILLARHAGGVWRSALGSVRALPSCPSDMTQAQYATLAFDDWCQSCLAPTTETASWLCRVRYCKSCMKKKCISEEELMYWIPGGVTIEKLDTVFPYTTLETSNGYQRNDDENDHLLYFFPAVQKYIKELEDIVEKDDRADALARWCAEKKKAQCKRITHAALFEFWNTHWAFRRSSRSFPSYLSEVALIVFLTTLLIYLWREKLFRIGVV